MKRLIALAKHPKPFEPGTKDVWLDLDIAEYVLKAHFDETIPGGSREITFIDEAIDFITQLAPKEKFEKVIDLGCGPGLYTLRLAKKGYDVVGVDFNKTSIDYAINESVKHNITIDYRIEDITNIEIENEFDLALLIYQIYCVFSLENRIKILRNVHRGLKPGGLVLFDVLSEFSYDNYEENLIWSVSQSNSPMSDKEHLVLYATIKYPNRVSLAKNILIFEDGEIVNYNYWNQHFSINSLEKEVNEAGFSLEKVYADVNGGEYISDSDAFAVVLKKK